jgi:hypothetical protein
VPKSDQAVDGLDRIQRILAGAVRILLRLQVGFEDGFKYQHRRRLNNPIAYRRDPQRSHFLAVRLRNVDPSDRLRSVRLVPELLRQFPEPWVPVGVDIRGFATIGFPILASIRLDVVERLAVSSSCAAIGFASGIGEAQNVRAVHLVIQKIEPILGFCLRFRM